MENKVIVFILATFLIHKSEAQASPALEVDFIDPKTRFVELGSEVVLDYTVNQNPFFSLNNPVLMLRQNVEDGKVVTYELAETAKLIDGEPGFYDVNIDTSLKDSFIIRFKIKKVRDVDDATFMCKVVDEDADYSVNKTVDVVVLRPNDKLHLQFATFDSFTESMDIPFEVDSGTYPVSCISEGSNPMTHDLKIYWNGVELPLSDPVVEQMDASVKKFRTTVNAELSLSVDNSGQDVECMAVSMKGEKLITKAPIKSNVYDPEVTCSDSTAFVGKRYPVLSCTIDVTGHEINNYAYQFGEDGNIIYAGEQSNNFDEVIKTDLGDSKVKVDLKLHRVNASHFAKYYLVISHKNGHVTREAVTLEEVEGPKDGSSLLGVSPATYALCIFCALWQALKRVI